MLTTSIADSDVTHEIETLAAEIFSTTYLMTWGEAYDAALAQLPELLAYAARYDADAERARGAAGVMLMPEGDMLDADGMRLPQLEAERAALYAVDEPTADQWVRLHDLDLKLGY